MTAIHELFEPVRAVLGDLDREFRRYADAELSATIRSAIRLGKHPDFALSANRLGIEPDITDPDDFAVIVYEVARMFVAPNPDRYEYQTRALKERFGSYEAFMAHIDKTLFRLVNGGGMFSGWQSYYEWMQGMHGLPLGAVLTDVRVTAPVATVVVPFGD